MWRQSHGAMSGMGEVLRLELLLLWKDTLQVGQRENTPTKRHVHKHSEPA